MQHSSVYFRLMLEDVLVGIRPSSGSIGRNTRGRVTTAAKDTDSADQNV